MELDKFCYLVDKDFSIKIGSLFNGYVVTNILTYNEKFLLISTCSINYKI